LKRAGKQKEHKNNFAFHEISEKLQILKNSNLEPHFQKSMFLWISKEKATSKISIEVLKLPEVF